MNWVWHGSSTTWFQMACVFTSLVAVSGRCANSSFLFSFVVVFGHCANSPFLFRSLLPLVAVFLRPSFFWSLVLLVPFLIHSFAFSSSSFALFLVSCNKRFTRCLTFAWVNVFAFHYWQIHCWWTPKIKGEKCWQQNKGIYWVNVW